MYQQLLLCALLVCFMLPCHFRDTITSTGPSGSSKLNDGDTIVSSGKIFELGFFSPQGAGTSSKYVGIWYYRREPKTVVWVANRDYPLSDGSGVFAIKDGHLTVSSRHGSSYFSTGTVKLWDSGNLVFSDESGKILWQSFDHPTDTFLPGMNMTQRIKLISWSSDHQPVTGNYTFQLDKGTDQYSIIDRGQLQPHWKSSRELGDHFASSTGMPPITTLLSNSSKMVEYHMNKRKTTSGNNNTITLNMTIGEAFRNTRLLMNSSGEIQFYMWDDTEQKWYLKWQEPKLCSVYNACGDFGSCSSNHDNTINCKCLPGYRPEYPKDWESCNYSGGCSRKPATSSSSCNENVTFLNLPSVKCEDTVNSRDSKTEEECKQECLSDCQCLAYSFRLGSPGIPDVCKIWTTVIKDLQETYNNGPDLSVRVAIPDLESTSRSCKPCGINVIPYPLSSQPGCGDPQYYNFSCDMIGKLSFNTSRRSYPVTIIDVENQNFVIEVVDDCDAFEVRQPFLVESRCNPVENKNKIEISWEPPSEPSCKTDKDCKDWPNSSCSVTEQGERRCLCSKPNYEWNGTAINCTPASSKRKVSSAVFKSLISISAVVLVILLCSLGYIIYQRKFYGKRREIILGMSNIGRQEQDLITEDDKKAIEVPFFHLRTILKATDNFSDANKLGQGGFGPVYKGNFPGGKMIAVKRLLSNCGQGVFEFKNEVMLIAKLQHRNLVKLLGYCIATNEKILLYEYMPNKSLDTIIFDCTLSVLLDWKMRFDIILGIARGLLYLHQDSRLRIIHRDLKASNVLLDEEMNPKISDFGLARIVEGKSIEANTNKVVGTFGYMSPEYALEGLFSIKSDVFSFGVVVLEIITGRRNTSFYQSQESLNLLGHAWKLWMAEAALDMVDPLLLKSSTYGSEILKCIHIGLLCVQEDPSDRPTMADVVIMFANESMTLPRPNQPAFVARKRVSSISSSSSSSISKPSFHSNNEITVTMLEGR